MSSAGCVSVGSWEDLGVFVVVFGGVFFVITSYSIHYTKLYEIVYLIIVPPTFNPVNKYPIAGINIILIKHKKTLLIFSPKPHVIQLNLSHILSVILSFAHME